MTISARKTSAVLMLKTKLILSNPVVLIGPVMAILFALVFQTILPVPSGEPRTYIGIFCLDMGVLFNTLLTGLMASMLPLAEDKEKNTLRVLMTSSINSAEFFLGSLLPVFVLTELVNLVLLPLCRVAVPFLPYLAITSVMVLITLLIGACLGLLGKNQTSASLVMTPLMVLLLLPSVMSGLNINNVVDTLAGFIYTGVAVNDLNALAAGQTGGGWVSAIVNLVWLAAAIVGFVLLYRKNRIDRA